jgi:DNA-binding response OmpR family regulator
VAKQNLLVADADPRSLRIAEVALRRAGYAVATASDGAEALRRIQRAGPDLVVAELSLPSQDGASLCRAVRADPHLARLPFVLMSGDRDPQSRARAMEAGADDFLEKPLLVKDLVGRVRTILSRHEQERFKGRAPAALSGTVGELGLVDLFSSLESWQKSAIVVCEDEARVARVWVRDGQVVDAELESLGGADAFYRLLTWEAGVFRVEFGPIHRAPAIRGATQALLLEGIRRMDEAGTLAQSLPPTLVLQVDISALAQHLSELPDEANGVLRLVDGRRPLREIVSLSPLDDLSTLAVVQRLLGDRVLRRAGKPSGARGKPALSEWLRTQPTPAVIDPVDAPSDAAELLLPNEAPLPPVEPRGPLVTPKEAPRAPAFLPTPSSGAPRAPDAREGPDGMALRLTDMLDMPLAPERPGPNGHRNGDGAAKEKAPRVRWAEIADEAAPRPSPLPSTPRSTPPSTPLDAKKFEPPSRQVAPVASAAKPAHVSAGAPRQRGGGFVWAGVGVVAVAAAAAFLLRPAKPPQSAPRPVASASVAPSAPAPPVETHPAPEERAAPVLSPAVEFGRAMASGQSLLKKGRYRAAVAELRKAVDLEPESVAALLALGDAFLEADQARSALPHLQKAAQLDRRSGRVQLLLGTAHQTLGHKSEALRAYRRYLELEPKGDFAGDVRAIVQTLSR